MKNLLPVEQFIDSVVLEDETAAKVFKAVLGAPVAKTPKEESLDALARRRCWYFIRTGRNKASCPAHQRIVTKLYCDIVDDPFLNAAATTSGEHNIIGLNSGAVANIFGFFYMLLSHPKILPEYGFPEKESQWSASLGHCDWRQPMFSLLRQSFSGVSLRSIWKAPNDWFRQSIADTLSTMALDFLFFHELAHLRRGHLHYLQTEANANKIDETWSHWSGADAGTRRAKQALELDADGGAMEVTLTPWLRGGHVRGFSAKEAEPDEAVVLWSIAVAFLFLLMDPFPSRIEDYVVQDHPHPVVRLTHVFLQARHVAGSISKEVARGFEGAWWEALRQVAVASGTLDLRSSVFHAFHSVEMEEIVAEQQRLARDLMRLVDTHASLQL
jgi:hypothetical protein